MAHENTWGYHPARGGDVLAAQRMAGTAGAERWIRSAREERLRHLVLFGIKSLRRAVRAYQRFHSGHLPHQGIGNQLPRALCAGEPDPEVADGPVGKVHCDEFLGCLLKSYRRAA